MPPGLLPENLSIPQNLRTPKFFPLSKWSARMFARCCEQKIVMSVSMWSASFHACVNKPKRSLIRN